MDNNNTTGLDFRMRNFNRSTVRKGNLTESDSPGLLTAIYRRTITTWIKEACEANEMPWLTNRISWEFNGRFTRRMGDACLRTNRIRLSAPLWERAGAAEQKNTVKHEVCHLIAYKINNFIGSTEPHGKLWKACMIKAGEEPTRCHTVNRDGLKRRQKRYKAKCRCMTHTVTATKRGKMLRGQVRVCRRCRGRLELI
jgi:SprT protein